MAELLGGHSFLTLARETQVIICSSNLVQTFGDFRKKSKDSRFSSAVSVPFDFGGWPSPLAPCGKVSTNV